MSLIKYALLLSGEKVKLVEKKLSFRRFDMIPVKLSKLDKATPSFEID